MTGIVSGEWVAGLPDERARQLLKWLPLDTYVTIEGGNSDELFWASTTLRPVELLDHLGGIKAAASAVAERLSEDAEGVALTFQWQLITVTS